MAKTVTRTAAGAGAAPQFWTLAPDGAGRSVLTYAVRGGKAAVVLGTLGGASLLAGAWGAAWLLGDGLTAAGLVLAVLVPGGLIAFGVHCLHTAFWARREYLLGSQGLTARRHALWGSGAPTEIPRASITAITQHYSPPGPSSPRGAPGTWATFLAWRSKDGREAEFPFDGMGSPEEARWLGPVLAQWADVPLKRMHGAGFEEADPAELPTLDA